VTLEVIINITKEINQVFHENRYPQNESHEGCIISTGTSSPVTGASIHMTNLVNGNYLLDLPQGM
jgi:hypothetical protein